MKQVLFSEGFKVLRMHSGVAATLLVTSDLFDIQGNMVLSERQVKKNQVLDII